MKRIGATAVVMLLVAALSVQAGDKPDPRLNQVTSIFVEGNNQAAEQARDEIRNGKGCFTLAGKADDADAVLKIDTDTQSTGGPLLGLRDWIASATLTLKSGELVWSRSTRFTDAPFMSGGKMTGKFLVNRLAVAASCKQRGKL